MTAPTTDNLSPEMNITLRPQKTAGEQAFGYIKYVGVGFLANLGIGYVFGRDDIIRRRFHDTDKKPLLPKEIQRFNEKMEEKIAYPLHWALRQLPLSLRPGITNNVAMVEDNIIIAEKVSRTLSNAILLSWGGILVSIGMHKLEKNKLPIIRKLDQWSDSLRQALGYKIPPKEVFENRELRYTHIAAEAKASKDSLGLILATRGLAMGATVATTVGAILVDPKRKGLGRIEEYVTEHIDHLENKLIEKKILRNHIFGDGTPKNLSVNEELFSLGFMECIVGGYTSLADYWRNKHVSKKEKADHAVVSLAEYKARTAPPLADDYRMSVTTSREPITAHLAGGF